MGSSELPPPQCAHWGTPKTLKEGGNVVRCVGAGLVPARCRTRTQVGGPSRAPAPTETGERAADSRPYGGWRLRKNPFRQRRALHAADTSPRGGGKAALVRNDTGDGGLLRRGRRPRRPVVGHGRRSAGGASPSPTKDTRDAENPFRHGCAALAATPPPCGARKTLRTFVCLRFSTAAEIPASLHLPLAARSRNSPGGGGKAAS